MTKDGGDDVDATHGLPITAAATRQPGEEITLRGDGVGRVTRPGLDQPVGEWAINSGAPADDLWRRWTRCGKLWTSRADFSITHLGPRGTERPPERPSTPTWGWRGASPSWAPRGIVEPMSVQALVDTMALELRQAAAGGARRLVLTRATTGWTFPGRRGTLRLPGRDPGGPVLQLCGGGPGQRPSGGVSRRSCWWDTSENLVKLAAGIMNTHSRWADGRAEVLLRPRRPVRGGPGDAPGP